MFDVGEWPLVLIISHLDVLKNDFGEVDETMFQGVESPYELLFCIMSIEKATWMKSLK
jgi:hypothetical protein